MYLTAYKNLCQLAPNWLSNSGKLSRIVVLPRWFHFPVLILIVLSVWVVFISCIPPMTWILAILHPTANWMQLTATTKVHYCAKGFNFTERCGSFRYLGLHRVYFIDLHTSVWTGLAWLSGKQANGSCFTTVVDGKWPSNALSPALGVTGSLCELLGITAITYGTQTTNAEFWSDAADRLIHYSI